MLSLSPQLVGRYTDIAGLLFKYGRADIARAAGLPESLAGGSEEQFKEDGEAGPESLADDLERRGPTFVKLAQLLSTRADLLPEPYLEALSRLQDDVAPVPFEEISNTITDELGIRISRGFKDFDEKPFASASLGQVHRATLRDGRDVVVKVQRPGIRSQIVTDLEALTELAEFLDQNTSLGKEAGLVDIVNSLQKTIMQELDYQREAAHARTLAANLARFQRIVIPQPVEGYVSARVITMDYVAGVKVPDVSPTVLLELDRSGLASELFNAYLQQVLVDGCFHSDPHPGNLILTHDHRLALMDFGMTTRVGPQMQQRLLKLLLAIADGLGEEAARVAVQMGHPREEFDEQQFIRTIAAQVTEHHQKRVDQLQAGQIVMEIQRTAGKCGLRLPHELTMLGKTLLNLDKVLATLSPDFDPNQALRERASEILREQTTSKLSLTTAFHSLLEASEFAQNLPSRANRIAELLANNQLNVKVDALDEKRLMSGMQKIANRIATGLVLGALIMGASTLMQTDSNVTFTIATIFFLIAGICGLILVFRALFGDESHTS